MQQWWDLIVVLLTKYLYLFTQNTYLTFRWPCIEINSCSKTNQMHLFLKFIFGIKLYMIRTVSLSIIRSFSLYTQQWYVSYRFAVCTVENSWWWTDELSESCRDIFQKKKIEKLVNLVGFIIGTEHVVKYICVKPICPTQTCFSRAEHLHPKQLMSVKVTEERRSDIVRSAYPFCMRWKSLYFPHIPWGEVPLPIILTYTRTTNNVFFYPMPHMPFTDFVVFPPGHDRSVTDFWGWDAHEARLRCPDDVSI